MALPCREDDCEHYSHGWMDCSNEKNRKQGCSQANCPEYEATARDEDGIVIRSRCEFLGNKCCSVDECEYADCMRKGCYFDCDYYIAFI